MNSRALFHCVHVYDVLRKMIHDDKSRFGRFCQSVDEVEPVNNEARTESIPITVILFFGARFVYFLATETRFRFDPINYETVYGNWQF